MKNYRVVAERHEVWIGNKQVNLSPKEYDILAALTASKRTMSREELLKSVWKDHGVDIYETRTVDQHVARLRRKMGDASPVVTVPTRGYKIAA